MRNRDVDRKMFHKGHYEVIAGQFRRELEPILNSHEHHRERTGETSRYLHGQSTALVNLALAMARRLQLDNHDFDPVIFLDKCSPDSERYPISELYGGVSQAEEVGD
jgi:hypothetical protein